MQIITRASQTPSSTFNKRLRDLGDFETQIDMPEASANENSFFEGGHYERRGRNGALLEARNNAFLVEGRPENVYGEDCVECRETYRQADVQSRALTLTGITREDSAI